MWEIINGIVEKKTHELKKTNTKSKNQKTNGARKKKKKN